MHMDNKRLMAVAAVVIVVCAAFTYVVYDDDDGGSGPTWTYSNLVGNLPDTIPDAADDFYLNTNHEWLSEHQGTAAQDSAIVSLTTQALTDIVSLVVTDPGDPNVSVYAQYMTAYLDTATRDTVGADDLMPYISGLMEAQTLSDLTDYLTSGSCVIADPFMYMEVTGLDNVSDVYIPYISYSSLTLSSPSLYLGGDAEQLMASANDHYANLLMLVGYTQEQAVSMNVAATSMEIAIALGITSNVSASDVEDIHHPYTSSQLDELIQSFPVTDILEAYGYGSDTYSVTDMGWLQNLDSLYTEENFEGLRAMILRNTIDAASAYMGGEFLEEHLSYKGTDLVTSWSMLLNTDVILQELIDRMYIDHASNPDAEALVQELFADLKDAFAERISSADWMTDPTKQYALQKLDAMTITVGGPDALDFSSIVLPSASGGNALDNYVALKGYYSDRKTSQIGEQIDSPYWPMKSYTTNAIHVTSMNRVYVSWAFLQDGYYYNSYASNESVLGRLGMVIGHEITHGFDTHGSQYGIDGTRENWWTEEDRAAFQEHASAVAEYISGITLSPDRTMDPSIVIDEVIADMGGMALVLDLADDRGLDIEQVFLEYAEVWATTLTGSYDVMIQTDSHPPDCARVNMTVQQFQQFHDILGVTEGDGMWLAPEDRVAIW